ncbi:hypothetical protein PR003_g24567 [Phytophthora rubi]|uniref:Uncharacterized protein n=1 Tax=Phytophthora rubi TaxID=129364 RepID=A0A6A3IIX8_9STRA|nr:hypothetical protein PR001_g23828 [Phytophthora rubi]KAE9016522.1 hypothetical protein PR002_g13638 [Phytophthora rubi]KAE9293197.1 hypothetical protein PR003_g24567 [Phytophthora rubi]
MDTGANILFYALRSNSTQPVGSEALPDWDETTAVQITSLIDVVSTSNVSLVGILTAYHTQLMSADLSKGVPHSTNSTSNISFVGVFSLHHTDSRNTRWDQSVLAYALLVRLHGKRVTPGVT